MIRKVVTVGGPPGSGKSTAGRGVAKELTLTYRSAGDVFREEARRRGMDLEAFGRYAEAHLEIDRALDEEMQAFARPGTLLDGRLQGELCRRRGVPVYEVLVTASEGERIRRVAQRDGQSLDEAQRKVAEREQSERTRYAHLYGIDLDGLRADLTIDTTSRPPEEVVRAIVSFLRSREGTGAP